MSMIADRTILQRMIDEAPPFLRHHLEGTGELGEEWGAYLGLAADESTILHIAAYAHDVGKLVIPPDVLLKPMELDPEELIVVRRHVECGVGILNGLLDSSDQMERIVRIIGQHHERVDGTGYPLRLFGEVIDPLARRLSIIDAFAAMTETRPYQKFRSQADAMDELDRCAGTQFDEVFVDEFLAWRTSR